MKDIVITATRVKGWVDTQLRLESEIESLKEELAQINQRLEAVSVFTSGAAFDEDDTEFPSQIQELPGPEIPLPTILRTIYGEANQSLATAAVKAELRKRNYPMEKLGKNGAYLYTVIRRLHKRGDLQKRGRGYAMTKKPEAPEGASVGGGVAE